MQVSTTGAHRDGWLASRTCAALRSHDLSAYPSSVPVAFRGGTSFAGLPRAGEEHIPGVESRQTLFRRKFVSCAMRKLRGLSPRPHRRPVPHRAYLALSSAAFSCAAPKTSAPTTRTIEMTSRRSVLPRRHAPAVAGPFARAWVGRQCWHGPADMPPGLFKCRNSVLQSARRGCVLPDVWANPGPGARRAGNKTANGPGKVPGAFGRWPLRVSSSDSFPWNPPALPSRACGGPGPSCR
jgi:hypothetical protein